MSQAIEALKRDHANIAKLLDILESEILAIEVGKTPDQPLMRDIMRYMAEHSDRFHHPKEDLIFAQLLKREPSVRADVEELIQEHVFIRLAGQEFIGSLHSSGADSVDAREQLGIFGSHYIRALREHMAKEEKKLFPVAKAMLTAREWRMIDAAITTIDDPLFDEMTADDYQRLYRVIAEQSPLGP
jgi:hemerythrin-like domain-containing protein